MNTPDTSTQAGGLFRPQRGSLRAALREQRFLPSRAALGQFLREDLSAELVSIDPYGFDDRIGWDTHIVLARFEDGIIYPVGFTDGPFVG